VYYAVGDGDGAAKRHPRCPTERDPAATETVVAVSGAITRLMGDPELRARLGQAGIEMAQEYAWERRIDALEGFLRRVAASRRMAVAGELP
jgi:glycosyltransferase involved in cell wall biosynthesis